MNRKTVLMFGGLAADQVERIRQEGHEVLEIDAREPDNRAAFLQALPRADGMIGAGPRITADMLDAASRLKVISSVSVGVDKYPLSELHRRGIVLCHTPDVLTEAVADMLFAMILASSRRLVDMAALVAEGRWVRALSDDQFGWDVNGKTVGIIGYGRIGRALARRAALGFNMPVLYHSRRPTDSGLPAGKAREASMEDLLAAADFVVVMAPLNDQTRGLVGPREFSLMKPGAILVNAARGPVVQEKALLEALNGNRLRGAALDVFDVEPLPTDSPLRGHPKVLALPHMGSATHETRAAMAELAARNLLCVLRGEAPVTPFATGG